jgi:hypothetical protein
MEDNNLMSKPKITTQDKPKEFPVHIEIKKLLEEKFSAIIQGGQITSATRRKTIYKY